jgi:hypothetical protein
MKRLVQPHASAWGYFGNRANPILDAVSRVSIQTRREQQSEARAVT